MLPYNCQPHRERRQGYSKKELQLSKLSSIGQEGRRREEGGVRSSEKRKKGGGKWKKRIVVSEKACTEVYMLEIHIYAHHSQVEVYRVKKDICLRKVETTCHFPCESLEDSITGAIFRYFLSS